MEDRPAVEPHPKKDERRRFGRRHSRVHGWVTLNRRSRIPCVMTDYSEGGARLALAEAAILPPRFLISFDGFAGAIYCELRHASMDQAGVAFSQNQRLRTGNLRRSAELLIWLEAHEPLPYLHSHHGRDLKTQNPLAPSCRP